MAKIVDTSDRARQLVPPRRRVARGDGDETDQLRIIESI
jgi:hypothetical protein